ncbi:MAG: cupin-like domain-containing protein [Gammaproteobacteria bacterium]|nr:cupin-like domain-containing protein [Gammaproteobacteria bacterium]MBU2058197.1 cupin-like domain-containing protein [Gammaproteobacteria bacterium]MBU2176972.1 cupin-like domain-containing protein [Gammaproteobacteria bacterium]MBU2246585.1 cupin-like domain-containing protein [Gammaproteobacteria bacterium]MBU2344954.1 cupin-like domain-containing protein [Gammaproteobacteria bacterium]
MMDVRVIENSELLSVSDFNSELYQNSMPAIFRGAANSLGCYNEWTLDYLEGKLFSKEVEVNYCEVGNYDFTIEGRFQEKIMPFSQLANLIRFPHAEPGTYYLQAGNINKNFPELFDGLCNPRWLLSSDCVHDRKLWVGEAGCTTQLHYDTSPNFLLQLAGRKEGIIYSPLDSPYLYAKTEVKKNHVSQVDINNVDAEKFPLFPRATPIKFVLEQGDILFLPPGWWHQFTSITPCINVNFWWLRFDVVENVGIEYMDVEALVVQVKKHLDRGFDINHQVYEGDIILLKAIIKGFDNLTEALLKSGANANVESVHYRKGASALSLATERQSNNIVRLLLKYGATDKNGEAFALAEQSGYTDIAELLQQHQKCPMAAEIS